MPKTSRANGPHTAEGISRHWVFAGLRRPIIATGLSPLAAPLGLFLPNWPHRPVEKPAPAPPDVTVEIRNRRYVIDRRDRPQDRVTVDVPFVAATEVVSGLIDACLAQIENAVRIHAAAAEVGRGVVLLIGGPSAGKSSVGLHLAAAGRRSYGDDVIVVQMHRGTKRATAICLGLAAKVCLPLPDGCAPGYRRFVARHTVFRNETRALLRLENKRAACFGEEREIAALIALDRRASGEAVLTPTASGAMLRRTLESSSSVYLTTDSLLTGLNELTQAAPTYALRFSSSAAAAALVEKELCAG